MNGAQSLTKTLVNCGVEVCFANPGTSEMHFVAALDSAPGLRADLAIWDVKHPAELTYRIGFNPLHARIVGGEFV